MKSRFLMLIVAASFAGYMGEGQAQATSSTSFLAGSCKGFDLSEYVQSDENTNGEGWTGVALYDGIKLFSDPNGQNESGTIKLGESVQIIEDGEQFVGVRAIGAEYDDLLWVNRDEISCGSEALISEATKLERKAVIKTETVRSDKAEGQSVSAYRTPELTDCDDNCRKLSRFELYFIVAETKNSVLLSSQARFSGVERSPFVGWISKEDIYEWPYSVGLRIDDDFRRVDENGKKTSEYGAVCGYLSLEEAEQGSKDKCQPILGGPTWYKTSTRLLVMEQHKSAFDGGIIFETVAPIVSTAGKQNVSPSDQSAAGSANPIAVDPGELRGASVDVLLNNNRFDIFFLIDGTQSMEPYIDAIRGSKGKPGVVQTITSGFERDVINGITLRAGYRVFRDTNGVNKKSLGEGLPLPEQDCTQMSADDAREGLEAFRASVSRVQVSIDVNDDFSEDLYGGLNQVLRDIRSCPKNRKLIFVISDAGYDADKQRERGLSVPDMQKFADRFNDNYPGSALFFLRPPRNEALAQSKQSYASAFDNYERDADQVLRRLNVVKSAEKGEKPVRWLYQLGDAEYEGAGIVGAIAEEFVNPIAQPKVVNEIIIDLRGGASLEQAIARLRRDNTDIPAYFWRLVKDSACKDLKDACTNATYQSVSKVFVRQEPGVTLDVWMTASQVQSWIRLLDIALEFGKGTGERRDAVASSLELAVRTIIREPAYDDENETIGQYLQRAGVLPIGFKTPLLSYRLRDILDQSRVSGCELRVLLSWMDMTRLMLKIPIQSGGTTLPVFTESTAGSSCPNMTEAGRLIRTPSGSIGQRKIPENGGISTTAVDFSNGGGASSKTEPIYWIPQQYLP